MTTFLQPFLLCKPPPSLSSSKRFHLPRYAASSSCLSFNLISFSTFTSSNFLKSQLFSRTLSVPCTLRPESGGLDSERLTFSDNFKNFYGDSSSLNVNSSFSEFGISKNDELGGGNSEIRLKSEFGEVGLENGEAGSEKLEQSEGKDQNLAATEGKSGTLSDSGIKSRLPLVMFLIGTWVRLKKGFEKVLGWEWSSWWPFWRREKRLERLIAEADANPKDVAKQNALLAELNKHSPESVINRFEGRDHAVDSRGVAEYLRALVVTNAISDYLPDEETGKPSSLPTLLQELKQRASGNMDEAFLNPGISEKQPLHVVMVEPKVSNKSRFVQDLISTILFTVAVGLVGLMGAAAFQKYVGNLGGIGASGVGSSSSYAPKELNRDVIPEKNVKTFKDVKGCDDAKQELEEVVEYLKNPSKFTRLGGKLPKGILLTGAPGTGKTLLAKAIAGEAGVPFFYRAGSEFEEMFVGVGARRVRSLFQAAKKKAPCIIFIDEIDAVGSTRKQWEGHTKKTLHQLLVEMDGFEQNEGIILMAATNLPDILDPALTRPGRFDRHLTAYHESGHAIVAFNTEGAHPIHKATIMPRGSALGMVTQLPSSDETSISKKQLLARLDVCMGGRVAEELIFGQDQVTTGASSDLHTATELAHYMKNFLFQLLLECIFLFKVSKCGMSDTIGPVHINEQSSSEMQSRIDAEVVKLLREAYDRVKALLKKHEKALHSLANALLDYETLSAEEIKRILLLYREGRLPEQQEQEGNLVLV